MAGGFAFAKADVAGPQSWEGVTVVVRKGRLTIDSALVSEDVVRSERLSATRWQVVLGDDQRYEVTRVRGGCGCARG